MRRRHFCWQSCAEPQPGLGKIFSISSQRHHFSSEKDNVSDPNLLLRLQGEVYFYHLFLMKILMILMKNLSLFLLVRWSQLVSPSGLRIKKFRTA